MSQILLTGLIRIHTEFLSKIIHFVWKKKKTTLALQFTFLILLNYIEKANIVLFFLFQ